MGIFRMIQVDFWEDDKVMEEMTPEDRYFFLYLLTNPKTTAVGIYPLAKRRMAYETGYSVESVQALIDRFEKHHKLIRYNPETREIAIKNWGKYNFNRGGKPVLDCVKAELQKVKDQSLIAYVSENITTPAIKALYGTYIDESDMDTFNDDSDWEETPSIEREKIETENIQLPQEGNEDLESIFMFARQSGFTFEHNFNKEQFFSWLKRSNIKNPRSALMDAFDTAIRNNNRTMKYVMGILKNWDKASGSQLRQDNETYSVQKPLGPGANYDPSVDRF